MIIPFGFISHRRPRPAGHWQGLDQERMLGNLLRHLDGMLFRCTVDAGRELHFVSEGAQLLCAYPPEMLLHNPLLGLDMLTHPEDRQAVRDQIMAAVHEAASYQIKYRLLGRDGAEKWVLERGACVIDELGSRVLEGFIEDINEQVLSQMRRVEAELRYSSIFENSVIGMFQTTLEGRYLAANQALADLYGYASPAQLVRELSDIGQSLYADRRRRDQFADIIARDGRVRDFESEVFCRDGRRIWISENAHAVRGPSGDVLYYEGTVEDISDRRQHQAELEYQATHDPLTDLPNRILLQDRLGQAVENARRYNRQVAVAFVDLDNFKIINDSLGHAVGDKLLQEIARRLNNSLRAVDTVARYGGDEFVLILCEQNSMADLSLMLERILASIAEPALIDGHDLRVSGSIGVTVYPRDGGDFSALLSQADAAMYHAKAAGRGQFQFFKPELNNQAHARLEMEMALRSALENNEMRVHYQPKVGVDGKTCGFEALIRWENPELGSVSPVRFIPVAEETGLIDPITDFVLREACREAALWASLGWPDMHMAVNLTARQFADPGLLSQIGDVLAESGLPAEALQLEITESMLAGEITRTVDMLSALKKLGVRIAVDDFGTGYSSLAYLKRFPIDILKIDRSFVMECDRDKEGMAIPRAVISLGHSLGLDIVAEGVEREEQFEILRQHGCEEFQGYLFSKPLPPEMIPAFLQREKNPAK